MKNLIALLVVGIVAFGCSNAEMEKRIAKLEGKVAELETKGGTKTATPAAAKATTPDVKPEGPIPGFEFTESRFDFGTINEGDVVDHVFAFTNSGDAPLIISNATGSCGCTVPIWPKDPIPVGGTGEIKVQFNSRNKPGNQNKTVTITANTYPKQTRLSIKANVIKKQDPS
ncbi:MAG: DUF1573 domain-containing protein [Cyclobacteriaceae bacterium]